MPQYYRLGNPAVTSISVDGVEHVVNADGLLEVHQWTTNIARELALLDGVPTSPEAEEEAAAAEEEAAQGNPDADERRALFGKIDAATGRREDRRRSLPQLREKWAYLQSRQSRAAPAQPAPPSGPNRPVMG